MDRGNDKTDERLDLVLVARGLAPTRSRAGDLVRRGLVHVNGRTATKPGASIGEVDQIGVYGEDAGHVSRGAVKLAAALDHFGLDVRGSDALDIGASTGGFTETLLARGARHVTAVDVGTGQLHPRLARDRRVVSYERLDARALTREHVRGPVGAITADVSFISLTLALPAALALAAPAAWLVALVKPQFELGPGAVGKRGRVRDCEGGARAAAKVGGWLEAVAGWRVLGVIPSPIAGKGGNREMLLAAVRDD
jgi:23S rRNA (cytidine1920-2'-O)/16S rRNA (cytidine1409-2'-O)-methyltransferase